MAAEISQPTGGSITMYQALSKISESEPSYHAMYLTLRLLDGWLSRLEAKLKLLEERIRDVEEGLKLDSGRVRDAP